MAAAMGIATDSFLSSSSSPWIQHIQKMNNNKTSRNRVNQATTTTFVSPCASISVADPYDTLRIRRGASESEVKKAFRRLALQYHPDVCRADNCTVKFQQINEAYDMVLSKLRGETRAQEMEEYYEAGMNDESEWDLWEEWMGWEGAGIRDYSSHINPYI